MADSNDLKVIVGLDVHESVPVIENDLKLLEKALARIDGGKLKIIAGLNVGATQNRINQQLKQLKINQIPIEVKANLVTDGKSLNINVNQIGDMSKNISGMTKEVSQYIKAMSLVRDKTGWLNAELEALFKTAKSALDTGDMEKYGQTIKKIADTTINRFSDMERASRKLTEQQKEAIETVKSTYFPDGLAAIGENDWKDLVSTFDNESNFKKIFRSVFGSNPRKWSGVGKSLDGVSNRTAIENSKNINTAGDALSYVLKTIIAIKQEASLNPITADQIIPEIDEKVKTILKYDDNIAKANNSVKELTQSEKELVDVNNKIQKLNEDANFAFILGEDDEFESINSQIKELENRKKVLEGIISQEKVSSAQFVASTTEMQQEEQKLIQNAQKISNNNGANIDSKYLSSNIEKIKIFADNTKTAEQSFRNLLAEMGDSKGSVTSKELKDATGQVNSFTVAVKSGTGALETFRYSFNEDDGAFKLDNITAANAGIQRLTESTQKYYASMEATITTAQASAQKLKATWSDTNGGKSVKDTEHLDSLKQKYAELMTMIDSLRGQSELEAKQTIADIKAKEKEINSLIGTYHNAEKVATDLRTKGYETVKEITGTKINTFEEKIKGALGSTEQLSAEMTNLRTKFESLNSATTQAEKSTILTSILDDLDKAKAKLENLKEVKKNFDDTSKSVNKVISDLDTISRAQIFNTHSNNAGVVEFQGEIKSLSDTAKQVKADLNALGDSKAIPPELKARVEELKKKFDELNGSNKTLQTNLRQNDGWARTERQIQTLTARIKEYMATNTKAASKYKSQFDGLFSGLSQAEINKDSEAVRRLSADFQILQHEIKAAGDQGKTLFERIKADVSKFTGWLSITTVVSTGVREIRKMVQEVAKLDNSLLELSKVSDLTADGIKKVTERAFELSKQVGKTGTDVIDATTNFKRAGFELEESINLAEKALVLTNVAEGIDDAGEAATALISIMKGYGDTSTEFAQKILDAVNEVSNTQAIDFDSLIDGSQRLAAVAKQGSMSFEQMLGILTGTNEVLQNIEKTSSGAITIFTRLQSVQLPDEEDVLPLAKLQETFNKNTNGMVNIIDQTTGELRNVYDILNDISEVWDTLDKNTQEGLAFAAAGTRQKNVFLSMMENWENVKKSVESANNSIGSATEENQKYLDSISGRLSVVESNFQSLSQTVINSNLVKFLVSGAGGALGLLDNIISKFGTLQTLLPIIMGSLSAFRNVGRAKMFALKREYADCNVVVTRNELMIA